MRVTGSTFLIVPFFFVGNVKNVMLSSPSSLQMLENSRLDLDEGVVLSSSVVFGVRPGLLRKNNSETQPSTAGEFHGCGSYLRSVVQPAQAAALHLPHLHLQAQRGQAGARKYRGAGQEGGIVIDSFSVLKKRSSQKEESPSVHVCFRWSQQRPLLAPPSVGDSRQSSLHQ